MVDINLQEIWHIYGLNACVLLNKKIALRFDQNKKYN